MCYLAQRICERYLKHVIDEYCSDNAVVVMKTHTLRNLRDFIKKNVKDFECDWTIVLAADGYYFSARYPGDDAIVVDEDDVKQCWSAVLETRRAVSEYVAVKEKEKEDILTDDTVLRTVKSFDD